MLLRKFAGFGFFVRRTYFVRRTAYFVRRTSIIFTLLVLMLAWSLPWSLFLYTLGPFTCSLTFLSLVVNLHDLALISIESS